MNSSGSLKGARWIVSFPVSWWRSVPKLVAMGKRMQTWETGEETTSSDPVDGCESWSRRKSYKAIQPFELGDGISQFLSWMVSDSLFYRLMTYSPLFLVWFTTDSEWLVYNQRWQVAEHLGARARMRNKVFWQVTLQVLLPFNHRPGHELIHHCEETSDSSYCKRSANL